MNSEMAQDFSEMKANWNFHLPQQRFLVRTVAGQVLPWEEEMKEGRKERTGMLFGMPGHSIVVLVYYKMTARNPETSFLMENVFMVCMPANKFG